MSGLLWIGVVLLLGAALVRERCALLRVRRRLVALEETAERLHGLRRRLRRERRRVRRSHQLKRRAQRVVGMIRTLIGCHDADVVAGCATQALVDSFGARSAAVRTFDESARLLGEASVAQGAGPGDGGREPRKRREITLCDAERRPVARLDLELCDGGDPPAGLSAYVAVLGAILGSCDRSPIADGTVPGGAGCDEKQGEVERVA